MNYNEFCKVAAGVALNMDLINKLRQAPADVQRAWNNAPVAAGVGGAALGVPAGLLAGAGAYGLLSLIPGLKKRKGVKLLAALLTGTGAGVAAGIPSGRYARNAYWKSETGLPSPWKTYTASQNGNSVSIKPADLAFDFNVGGHTGSVDVKAEGQEKIKMINDLLNSIKNDPRVKPV